MNGSLRQGSPKFNGSMTALITPLENNELDFPELEDIQIIKELTLSESLEKSSSISTLLNNKIISLGEEPKEKIYSLNCQT